MHQALGAITEQASHTVVVFFFFQAEDGIRDKLVTGVQTCALPISPASGPPLASPRRSGNRSGQPVMTQVQRVCATGWEPSCGTNVNSASRGWRRPGPMATPSI